MSDSEDECEGNFQFEEDPDEGEEEGGCATSITIPLLSAYSRPLFHSRRIPEENVSKLNSWLRPLNRRRVYSLVRFTDFRLSVHFVPFKATCNLLP